MECKGFHYGESARLLVQSFLVGVALCQFWSPTSSIPCLGSIGAGAGAWPTA
jgi:hypothetical protein